jgi:hypothetical protein
MGDNPRGISGIATAGANKRRSVMGLTIERPPSAREHYLRNRMVRLVPARSPG